MLRRNHILATAAALAVCASPASAATYEQLRAGDSPPPSSSIATGTGSGYQDLRSPDTRDAAIASQANAGQDLRSPDAADAAAHRGLYEKPQGPYTLARDFGSPDAADAARGVTPAQVPAPVVEVRRSPVSGFDWGDAGIGAAGMTALFSIAAGFLLLLVARRRRDGGGLRTAH